jgi:hemerythrin-like domain-containing protein
MKATDILMAEHRVIEQVLGCLEALAKQALAEGKLDGASARQALDFLHTFADGCHHAKEERHLFPRMEAHGFPRVGGPTGVMLWEHDEGRRHVQAMEAVIESAAAGVREAVIRFADHARSYAYLLREHIFKEDKCLFPLANHAFSGSDQAALLESFGKVEHQKMGEGTHEKYLRLADELAERLHVPKASESVAGVHSCGACGHHAGH